MGYAGLPFILFVETIAIWIFLAAMIGLLDWLGKRSLRDTRNLLGEAQKIPPAYTALKHLMAVLALIIPVYLVYHAGQEIKRDAEARGVFRQW